jgi:hypothetical protein
MKMIKLDMVSAVIVGAALIKSNGGSRYFWILAWPGTVVHEILHYIVALITFGKPHNLVILPSNESGGTVLGSVQCGNLNWFNKIPVALAPLLAIPIAIVMMSLMKFSWTTGGIFNAFIISSIVSSCVPSSVDMEIATSSMVGMIFWSFVGFTLFNVFIK